MGKLTGGGDNLLAGVAHKARVIENRQEGWFSLHEKKHPWIPWPRI